MSNLLVWFPPGDILRPSEVAGRSEAVVVAQDKSIGQEIKLPPLIVNIVRDGQVVRTVEMPDPREVFCRQYPEWDREHQAVPA